MPTCTCIGEPTVAVGGSGDWAGREERMVVGVFVDTPAAICKLSIARLLQD